MTTLSDSAGGLSRTEITSELAGRIASGLHLGLLAFGARLPSTRQLAHEFSVDPRVILGAYKSLEDRGIVEMRTRSGIYVANPDASAKSAAARTQWLIDVLAEGLGQGIPALEFSERVRRSLQTLRLRAVVLECNDDQLFSVADELERDYGLDVTAVDLDNISDSDMRAARADCIITTNAHAAAAESMSSVMGAPALILSMCDDLFAEVRRLLPRRRVYFVVSDERFERKLKGIFESAEVSSNLEVLVHGRDSIDVIPDDAPMYVTRLARRSIGDVPQVARLIPEARVFSEESSRDLLAFIVGANQAVMGR